VLDRGPGILPGSEQQIFSKFVRGTNTRASGSGIGLAICRAIVELHGGMIQANNRNGGGSVFRFTVPITITASEPIPESPLLSDG